MKLYELILAFLYNLNKRNIYPTRSELSLYLYLFTEGREVRVDDIVPMGIESSQINLLVDNLIMMGVIESDWGRLKLIGKIDVSEELMAKVKHFLNSILKIKRSKLIDEATKLYYKDRLEILAIIHN